MKVQIGEVFYFIQNGANIKQGVVDGGIPITRIETISNNQFNRDRMGYAGITDVQKYSPYILQDGDILMSHINSLAYLGRAVLYNKQNNETIIHGMNLLRLKANREIILPAYACYFFQTNVFKEQINRIAKKSVNQASFSVADLKQTVMSIVPLEEQNKIVNRLDKINSLISLRKKQLQKLDDLVKSRFVEMFGDPVENPKGYKNHPLQKLIEEGEILYHLDGNHGGNYPRSEEFVDKGVPYIGANCIIDGEVDFSMAKHLTPKRADMLRKGIAQDGDVLFAHNATVGPVAILHTHEPKVILSTSLTAFRCNREIIMPEYLAAYMKSDGFVRQYADEMKQTTRNQVPITAQKRYLFLVPPISEQRRFSDIVKRVDKSKLTVKNSLDKLELLKQSLMQKYFG